VDELLGEPQNQPPNEQKPVEKLSSGPSRWGTPVSDAEVEKVRKDGIPKATQKQTQWCTTVWKEWAAYRRSVIIEPNETAHQLLVDIDKMSKEDLQYWLVKFVEEVKQKDGNSHPPDTVYQIVVVLVELFIMQGVLI